MTPPRFRRLAACSMAYCAVLAGGAAVAVASDVFVPTPVPLNSNAASDSGDDTNVRLFSDGAGRVLAVWESKDDLGGTIGTDTDLLYAWSDDQGQTWSAPAPLNGDAATDDTDETLDELKLLGAGQWYAVWHVVPVPDGTCTRRWIARSSDNGATWSAPLEVVDPHAECSAMATNGQGTWLAAWAQGHPDHSPGCSGINIGFDIFVSRSLDDGTTWSEPALVDAAGRPCGCTLSMWCAIHDYCSGQSFTMYSIEGGWVLTWWEWCLFGSNANTEFLSSTSLDDGQTWSAPTAIVAPSPYWWHYFPSSVPQLSAPSAGLWCMFWNGNDQDYEFICESFALATSVSRDAGATWPSSVIFDARRDGSIYCRSRAAAFVPSRLAVDNVGNLLAGWWWTDSGTTAAETKLLVAHSLDDAATWSEPTIVDVNEDSSGRDDAVPLAAGDGEGRWALTWSFPNALGGTLGSDADILVVFSRDNGGTWTAPVALNPGAASDSVDDKPDAIISVGPGQWLVAWSGSLGGDYGSDKDILLTRLAYPDCDHNGVSDVQQTDSDGDTVIDACDHCPNDRNKTGPGACGCGTADTDTDSDGTPDCQDDCPDDPGKTRPGVCGCGTPDQDGDTDGTPDCQDECPDDPCKTAPGECGCGEPDDDSDGDGTLDCHDGCPQDPRKTEAGECGCGHAEGTCAPVVQDSDGDGVPDGEDGCPHDPDKTALGACGCGAADVDTDGDGVADCTDNCPDDSNPDQADADGDGIGDVCTGQAGGDVPAPRGAGICGGTAAAMIGLTLLGLIRARRGTPRAGRGAG